MVKTQLSITRLICGLESRAMAYFGRDMQQFDLLKSNKKFDFMLYKYRAQFSCVCRVLHNEYNKQNPVLVGSKMAKLEIFLVSQDGVQDGGVNFLTSVS